MRSAEQQRFFEEFVEFLKQYKGKNVDTATLAAKVGEIWGDKVGKGKETSDLLFTQDNTIKEESLSALLPLGFTKKVAYKKMEQVMKNHEGEITLEDLVRRSLG